MSEEPQTVGIIGGGVAGDLREILKHPLASVTYVELDPLLIKAGVALGKGGGLSIVLDSLLVVPPGFIDFSQPLDAINLIGIP